MTTPVLKIGLQSGTSLSISDVFLCLEAPLRKSEALRLKAADGLKGFSTGIGFWGSPGWALGGAVGLGIIEGLISSSATKAALQDLQEAAKLAETSARYGAFISVKDIDGISIPSPAAWRGLLRSAEGTYLAYAHNSEPFLRVNTLEAGVVYIAAAKIETFTPPSVQPRHEVTVGNEFGVTFNGQQYEYGGYRYDRLADAISYAKSQRTKA